MEAYIKGISYYLPSQKISNEHLALEFPEWSADRIFSKIGISNRQVVLPGELVSDLSVKASNLLFGEYQIDRNSIDFILLCTQSPDYFLPTTACLVQDRLGLSKSCGAIDFNQGCSGYIYGLGLAKGLIKAGIAHNILLITAETYSRHIHLSDKTNRSIFGDAASASLISIEGFASLGEFELGTDGSGAGDLIVKNGGMKHEKQSTPGNLVMDDYLFMDGAGVFNFTLQHVPELVNNTLKKNNVGMDRLNWFIFHQANAFMLNHLRKKIGIPPEKFLWFMENCGNTVSSTLPIVMKEHWRSSRFGKGEKILLAGFGVGYSWGGTVLSVV